MWKSSNSKRQNLHGTDRWVNEVKMNGENILQAVLHFTAEKWDKWQNDGGKTVQPTRKLSVCCVSLHSGFPHLYSFMAVCAHTHLNYQFICWLTFPCAFSSLPWSDPIRCLLAGWLGRDGTGQKPKQKVTLFLSIRFPLPHSSTVRHNITVNRTDLAARARARIEDWGGLPLALWIPAR